MSFSDYGLIAAFLISAVAVIAISFWIVASQSGGAATICVGGMLVAGALPC